MLSFAYLNLLLCFHPSCTPSLSLLPIMSASPSRQSVLNRATKYRTLNLIKMYFTPEILDLA